jgi:hypothetical protein
MSVFSVSQIGSQIDREINAEVRSHIEMRTADIIAAGMPPEKARRDALLKFGNPTVMRERVAGVDFALNLDIFFRDVQYAFRKLRKTPAFAITVILGIGGPSVYQSCELPVCRQTAPYSPEFEPDIALVEPQPQPQPQPRHGTPSAWMILCTVGSITSHWVAA